MSLVPGVECLPPLVLLVLVLLVLLEAGVPQVASVAGLAADAESAAAVAVARVARVVGRGRPRGARVPESERGTRIRLLLQFYTGDTRYEVDRLEIRSWRPRPLRAKGH